MSTIILDPHGGLVPSQVGFLSFQHRADGSGLDFEHANITGNAKEMAGASLRWLADLGLSP